MSAVNKAPAPPANPDTAELAALLARVGLGERAAFSALYDKTAARLLGVILRITRNQEQSEDILQEVYVSVWRHAGDFDARLSQPLTWLTSITRNRTIDSLRRRQTQPKLLSTNVAGNDGDEDHDMLQDFISDDPSPLELLERSADARALRACLQRLSGQQQQAIALAFFQGQAYSEVATHLSQPLGTVKSWLRRGLATLKSCLEHAPAAKAP
jgi:RNA polymerase sigma factor (sigma-70 family)